MISVPSPIFSPSPDAVDALLHALARPDISFLDLAATHKTTPEALSLWMTRPAIRERLAAAADLIAWRTQFVATHSLSAALNTLTECCKAFCADKPSARNTQPEASPPAREVDPERAAILLARRTETARRAATTILRLTILRSIGAPPIRPASPAPTVEVSERSKAGGGVSPNAHPSPQPPAPPSQISNLKLANPVLSVTPSRPNPAPNPNRNRLLPSRPLSPVSSLLDLVGASSIRTDLTFSPRDPFP